MTFCIIQISKHHRASWPYGKYYNILSQMIEIYFNVRILHFSFFVSSLLVYHKSKAISNSLPKFFSISSKTFVFRIFIIKNLKNSFKRRIFNNSYFNYKSYKVMDFLVFENFVSQICVCVQFSHLLLLHSSTNAYFCTTNFHLDCVASSLKLYPKKSLCCVRGKSGFFKNSIRTHSGEASAKKEKR